MFDSVRIVVFQPPPPPTKKEKKLTWYFQRDCHIFTVKNHSRMFDTIKTYIQFAIFVGKVRYNSMTKKPLLYCIHSS